MIEGIIAQKMRSNTARAPFQVLVIPFRRWGGGLSYAVFRRSDTPDETWQWIAGGGTAGETPPAAARREAQEEAGIPLGAKLIRLQSEALIPVERVSGPLWGKEIASIPEYCFGLEAPGDDLVLSGEHTEFRWTSFDQATELLRWESNRNALEELDQILRTAGGHS